MENVETKVVDTTVQEASSNPVKDKAPKKEPRLPDPILLVTKEHQLIAMVADGPKAYTKTYYNSWTPGQELKNPYRTKKVTLPVGIDKCELKREDGSTYTTTKVNTVWELWDYLTTHKGYKKA